MPASEKTELAFTTEAKRVIELAFEEARALKHNYISSVHLLLGVLRIADGDLAGLLDKYSITLASARQHVGPIAQPAPQKVAFTKLLKQAMNSLTHVSPSIDTGHMLMGLLQARDGIAAQALRRLSVDEADLYEAIQDLRKQRPEPVDG